MAIDTNVAFSGHGGSDYNKSRSQEGLEEHQEIQCQDRNASRTVFSSVMRYSDITRLNICFGYLYG